MKKILTIWVLFLSMIVSGCGQKVENKDLLSTIKQRGELVVGVKYDSNNFNSLALKVTQGNFCFHCAYFGYMSKYFSLQCLIYYIQVG